MQSKTALPSFKEATENGDIVEKSGYHKPDGYGPYQRGCGCDKTTPKGAYRDVTVELPDGRTAHYYHQTPVVVEEENGIYRLNSGGYRTSTTKERINRYLPRGYTVRQEDFTWYLEYTDFSEDFGDRETERIGEFEDGIELDA